MKVYTEEPKKKKMKRNNIIKKVGYYCKPIDPSNKVKYKTEVYVKTLKVYNKTIEHMYFLWRNGSHAGGIEFIDFLHFEKETGIIICKPNKFKYKDGAAVGFYDIGIELIVGGKGRKSGDICTMYGHEFRVREYYYAYNKINPIKSPEERHIIYLLKHYCFEHNYNYRNIFRVNLYFLK